MFQKLSKLSAIAVIIGSLIAGTAVYYFLIAGPEKQRNKRIQSLIEAGLSDEEAIEFDEVFADQSYRWPWQKNEPYSGEEIKLAQMWEKNNTVVRILMNHYYLGSSDYRVLIWVFGSPKRKVSYWENAVRWSIYGDANADGWNNYSSLLGSDSDVLETIRPNPITTYALKENLSKTLIMKLKPLEKDGWMADWEKWVVDQLLIDNISENRLNWIIDNFDPNPATIYALRRWKGVEEIERIKPLGEDDDLSEWEKHIIEHLKTLPRAYVDWARRETEPTYREKYLVNHVGNLPKFFISNVAKDKVDKYEVVSYEEWMQMQFLINLGENFLEDKSEEWINDPDLDEDGFTNEFEKRISSTDFLVRNDRFALLLCAENMPPAFEEKLRKVENFITPDLPQAGIGLDSETKPWSGFDEKNVIELYKENATFQNFQEGIEELSDKSGENDLVLFILAGHSRGERFLLSNREISYSKIKEELAKVKAKAQIVILGSCYSKSAISSLRSENRILITGNKSDRSGIGGLLSYPIFKAMGEAESDIDNNNYCSFYEAFLRASGSILSESGERAQLLGKELAENTYLIELNLRN